MNSKYYTDDRVAAHAVADGLDDDCGIHDVPGAAHVLVAVAAAQVGSIRQLCHALRSNMLYRRSCLQ